MLKSWVVIFFEISVSDPITWRVTDAYLPGVVVSKRGAA